MAGGCGSDQSSSATQTTTTTAGTLGGGGDGAGGTTTAGGGDSTTGSGGAGGSTTTASSGGGGSTTTSSGGGGTGGGTGGAMTGGGGPGGAMTGGGGPGGAMTGGGGTGGAGPCLEAADCDDGLHCNGVESCDNGLCAAGSSPCGDGVACTVDACDEATDTCSYVPSDALCADGLYCNGSEVCDPSAGAAQTGCVTGTSPCDDGVACTADACDEAMDACSHAANDLLCDNGIACDGAETCSAIFGCLSSGSTCDDGVSCTSDICNQDSGECAHVPNDNVCQNGSFCDGVESCNVLLGAPLTGCLAGMPVMCGDGIACTVDGCDEAADACVHSADNAACNDGSFCNGVETCVAGAGCQAGAPPSCNDGRSCTIDTCSAATDACAHAVNNAACDDGLDCNGSETCSLAGPTPTGCLTGTPIPCGTDGIACTIDACDEATNLCAHAPSNAACANGQLCIPAAGGCTAGSPCQGDAQCNDGNACNGVETCNGVCQPGVPVTCNDGVVCTTDSCNPMTGACTFAPNNAGCDDGFSCNGAETCSPQLGCVAGQFTVCDDGVACTADACLEPAGNCVAVPINANCDDGQTCNGTETCTVTGCQAGAALVCPADGIACTSEVCDPQQNACVSVENDSLCPCGQTCSAAQGGCGSFCTVSTCQGKVYACGDCLDNDGDCGVDSGGDSQCLGPCDNTEDSFYGGIPGQNNSPCKSDCYFDQDTGSGNDDCYWSHKCDPLEVAPNYPPEGSQCAYNPNANIPGYSGDCQDAYAMQSATCTGYCGPLTPNGCDCFGCCAIPGAPTTVWLGSENPAGVGSCSLANLNNPAMCKPCTQVPACLNTCLYCEICIGKPELPADCSVQECPPGLQTCGTPSSEPCGSGFTCITGCCQANPN